MRSLVVWIPEWSVIAACWDDHEPDALADTPLAVVHKGLVRECSTLAHEAGVRVGMKRREAQHACRDLVVLSYRPERDAAFFDRVLISLSEYVPDHALLSPGMVLFYARGLARFYGSEEKAAQLVRRVVLAEENISDVRVGVADDVFSAVMAATHSTRDNPLRIIEPGESGAFLARLPVSVLDDEHVVSLVSRLGITTLGEFVALGEETVRERLGRTGEQWYRLARGEHGGVPPTRGAPLDLRYAIELPESYGVVDQVAFAIKRQTEEYLARLRAADLMCTRVRITIFFDNNHEHTRLWLHPRFFTEAELVDRVRWQLEQYARDGVFSGDFPPGVIRVHYETLSPEDRVAHEPGLWGAGPDSKVHHVLSRVQGMVGASGVVMANTRVSRSSQDTQVLTPWGEKAVPPEHTGPLPGALPKPLPATVFQQAKTIDLLDDHHHPVVLVGHTLSGPPHRMSLGSTQRTLVSWAGPWPVAERWWEPHHARYYYRLQLLDDHGIGWLVTASPDNVWHLEARYD